jgi:hypothetical protein
METAVSHAGHSVTRPTGDSFAMSNAKIDSDIQHFNEEFTELDRKLMQDMGKDELAALLKHKEGGGRSYFRSKRVFYKSSVDDEESGWYFSVREGWVYGPFPDERSAVNILQGLIGKYMSRGDTGGR